MLGKKTLIACLLSLGIAFSPCASIVKPTKKDHEIIMCSQISEYDNLERIVEKEPTLKKEYIPMIEDAVKKYQNIHYVDPLLVIALLKAETYNFDKDDISWAGAAGLAQIIPETADRYGIKTYNPEYLHQAREDRRTAFSFKNKYLAELRKNDNRSNKRTAEYKKEYNYYKKKSDDSFKKYKKELEEMVAGKTEEELRDIDERFIPSVAIDFCVMHLAELLEARDGNVREAVSAYNAGLGAVKKYDGIPPYSETVKYQNKIMRYYNSYKKFMNN